MDRDTYTDNLNVKLLANLISSLKCKGGGELAGFMSTPSTWRCPCCARTKGEFAKRDKNGNLCCRIVMHHDHGPEVFLSEWYEREGTTRGPQPEKEALRASQIQIEHQRFEAKSVCEECNNADTAAKAITCAPPWFSFAPSEIARFHSTHGGSHVQADEVRPIYEGAIAFAKALRNRFFKEMDATQRRMFP